MIPEHIKDGSIKKGINTPTEIIKNLWNYVEDRRIDQYVFKSAPEHRGYYRKMYDKYFNDKVIDKGLQSDEFTSETIESYMFRIINLHNKNTNLSALKGLKEIYKLINLRNIGRLKNSQETFDVEILKFSKLFLNILHFLNQMMTQLLNYKKVVKVKVVKNLQIMDKVLQMILQ